MVSWWLCASCRHAAMQMWQRQQMAASSTEQYVLQDMLLIFALNKFQDALQTTIAISAMPVQADYSLTH